MPILPVIAAATLDGDEDEDEDLAIIDSFAIGGNVADIKSTDEYDNEDLNLKKVKLSHKNIIVDGLNLSHWLADRGTPKIEKAIELCSREFKKCHIYFVIKNINLPIDLLLIKYNNVTIVNASGIDAAIDDHLAIYLLDIIPDSILLTRDRYRDIDRIAKSPARYTVYGDNCNLQNALDRPSDHDISKATFEGRVAGFSWSKQHSGLYYCCNGKLTSQLVYKFKIKKTN